MEKCATRKKQRMKAIRYVASSKHYESSLKKSLILKHHPAIGSRCYAACVDAIATHSKVWLHCNKSGELQQIFPRCTEKLVSGALINLMECSLLARSYSSIAITWGEAQSQDGPVNVPLFKPEHTHIALISYQQGSRKSARR